MKKLNNKGLSAIEILLAFVLASIVSVTMFDTIMSYKNKQQIESYKTSLTSYINTTTKLIQDDIVNLGLKSVTKKTSTTESSDEYLELVLGFNNGTSKRLIIIRKINPELEGYENIENQDEKFIIRYDGIDYPIPNLGEYEYADKITYDLKINDIIYSTDNNMFNLYIGFIHPNLSTDYAIKIFAPINYS